MSRQQNIKKHNEYKEYKDTLLNLDNKINLKKFALRKGIHYLIVDSSDLGKILDDHDIMIGRKLKVISNLLPHDNPYIWSFGEIVVGDTPNSKIYYKSNIGNLEMVTTSKNGFLKLFSDDSASVQLKPNTNSTCFMRYYFGKNINNVMSSGKIKSAKQCRYLTIENSQIKIDGDFHENYRGWNVIEQQSQRHQYGGDKDYEKKYKKYKKKYLHLKNKINNNNNNNKFD